MPKADYTPITFILNSAKSGERKYKTKMVLFFITQMFYHHLHVGWFVCGVGHPGQKSGNPRRQVLSLPSVI